MEFYDGGDSSSILVLACVTFLFGAALTVGMYLFALNRKATDAVKEKSTNLKRIATGVPYSDAINRLIQYAPSEKYKVEDVAHDGSRVILGTSVTFFSYGFFYPVYFSVLPDGATLVEVGITSRAIQWGPVVSFNHDKAATMVSKAVLGTVFTQQVQPPAGYAQPAAPYPNQPSAGPYGQPTTPVSYPEQPSSPYPPNPYPPTTPTSPPDTGYRPPSGNEPYRPG